MGTCTKHKLGISATTALLTRQMDFGLHRQPDAQQNSVTLIPAIPTFVPALVAVPMLVLMPVSAAARAFVFVLVPMRFLVLLLLPSLLTSSAFAIHNSVKIVLVALVV